MGEYSVRLRYYPGDPLEQIRQEDLESIAQTCGVKASIERIENRTFSDGLLREETLDKTIEEMSQDVVSIESEDAAGLRQAVAEVYRKYRSPRTPFGFWGSTRDGERIAKAVVEETGGGW